MEKVSEGVGDGLFEIHRAAFDELEYYIAPGHFLMLVAYFKQVTNLFHKYRLFVFEFPNLDGPVLSYNHELTPFTSYLVKQLPNGMRIHLSDDKAETSFEEFRRWALEMAAGNLKLDLEELIQLHFEPKIRSKKTDDKPSSQPPVLHSARKRGWFSGMRKFIIVVTLFINAFVFLTPLWEGIIPHEVGRKTVILKNPKPEAHSIFEPPSYPYWQVDFKRTALLLLSINVTAAAFLLLFLKPPKEQP